MERWLLISNCQTYGVARSLQLLAPSISVDPVDLGEYQAEPDRFRARLPGYDRVVLGIGRRIVVEDFPDLTRADLLPQIAFGAFHPDLTYVVADTDQVQGPLGAYHSTIAFAAYTAGRSLSDTLGLFNAHVYESCGYLDRWSPEAERVTQQMARSGLEIGDALRRWSRGGCFMHSNNRPRIHVLYDVARMFLEAAGYAPQVSDVLPYDNLVNSAVFAVYPEIGEALGVNGAYLFKRVDEYRQLDLAGFVAESFAVYDRYPPGALAVTPSFAWAYDQVSAYLEGQD